METGCDAACADSAACVETPRISQQIVVLVAVERTRRVDLGRRLLFIILCDDAWGWYWRDVFVLGNLKHRCAPTLYARPGGLTAGGVAPIRDYRE